MFLFVLVNFNCFLCAKNNSNNKVVTTLTTQKEVRFGLDRLPILTGVKPPPNLNFTTPNTGMMDVKIISTHL